MQGKKEESLKRKIRKMAEVLTAICLLLCTSWYCTARTEGQITAVRENQTETAVLLIADETEKKDIPSGNQAESLPEQTESSISAEAILEQPNQGTVTEEQKKTNPNLDFRIALPPGSGAEEFQYPIALHERRNGQNPASILISGLIFAPAGTEIQEATVQTPQGISRAVDAKDIFRFQTEYVPANLSSLSFDSDKSRAAFGFFVNLSDSGLSDGTSTLTVQLKIADDQSVQIASINTNVVTDSQVSPYDTVENTLRMEQNAENAPGEPEEKMDAEEPAAGPQTNEASGTVTEDPASEALNKAEPSDGSEGTGEGTEKGNGSESDQLTGEAPQASDNGVLGFLNRPISLFKIEMKMWMVIAAGALLVIIVLIIVLLITGRKRKQKYVDGQGFDGSATPITDLNEEEKGTPGNSSMGPILSVGDEPTVDLESTLRKDILVEKDSETVEYRQTVYTIKLRLIFEKKYMDQDVQLLEEGKSVIGRGEEANIRTNPSDFSVSHAHGAFEVKNGMMTYTDTSRNGTLYNGTRTLHNGESVTIPFNTRAEMDIGAHKVLIMVMKEQ